VLGENKLILCANIGRLQLGSRRRYDDEAMCTHTWLLFDLSLGVWRLHGNGVWEHKTISTLKLCNSPIYIQIIRSFPPSGCRLLFFVPFDKHVLNNCFQIRKIFIRLNKLQPSNARDGDTCTEIAAVSKSTFGTRRARGRRKRI
jgi:hypothetical protein